MKNEKDEVFSIERTFDTDIETLFNLWVEPKHVSQWLAPGGVKTVYLKTDVRVGGMSHYYMGGPDGTKMWGKVMYKEILRPTRLVYIQCFSDENDGIGQHPMAPDFPSQMLTTVKFEAQGKKTKVNLEWKPYEPTTAQAEFFVKAKPGMTQGWTGSFEQLEKYIKETKY